MLLISHNRNFSEVIKDCDGGNSDTERQEVNEKGTAKKTIKEDEITAEQK